MTLQRPPQFGGPITLRQSICRHRITFAAHVCTYSMYSHHTTPQSTMLLRGPITLRKFICCHSFAFASHVCTCSMYSHYTTPQLLNLSLKVSGAVTRHTHTHKHTHNTHTHKHSHTTHTHTHTYTQVYDAAYALYISNTHTTHTQTLTHTHRFMTQPTLCTSPTQTAHAPSMKFQVSGNVCAVHDVPCCVKKRTCSLIHLKLENAFTPLIKP